MSTLAVRHAGPRTLLRTANASRVAMTQTLASDAALEIAWPSEAGVVLGALQRACDHAPREGERVLARGSPGCAVRVGPGTLHVVLALARPSALVDCDEARVLNRHVRPLLRALTKAGALAKYFGRDWISVAHHPAVHVGFAHSRATSRTVVEAFVAVRTPMDTYDRASYAGKAPSTLEALVGKPIDDALLERDVALAFAELATETVTESETESESETGTGTESETGTETETETAPWAAGVEEAIGPVCAGRDLIGRMRVGGEWMASFDAVRDLEDRLAAMGKSPDERAIAEAVQAAFDAPHTALFGVRSLESFRAVLASAYAVELE